MDLQDPLFPANEVADYIATNVHNDFTSLPSSIFKKIEQTARVPVFHHLNDTNMEHLSAFATTPAVKLFLSPKYAVTAGIDSLASNNWITQDTLDCMNMNKHITIQNGLMNIELGDGQVKSIPKKTITLTVALSEHCFFQVPFFIMPSGSNPVILGAPFFQKFSPHMNYDDRKIILKIKNQKYSFDMAFDNATPTCKAISYASLRRSPNQFEHCFFAFIRPDASAADETPPQAMTPEQIVDAISENLGKHLTLPQKEKLLTLIKSKTAAICQKEELPMNSTWHDAEA